MVWNAPRPSWSPDSEADIEEAIAAELLEETHYLELKREIESTKAANSELARDLAQFTVDSGALLVGVEEIDGRRKLHPVELDGLPERIEQIALSRVDRPLYVTCRPIPSVSNPALGYVWIEIAASAEAPHMGDGTYYGRGDKKRVRLSDSAVRRFHSQQERAEGQAIEHVMAYVRRDPWPEDESAHLFVVGVPTTPRSEMMVGIVDGPDAHSLIRRLVVEGAQASTTQERFVPSLTHAGSYARRADGAALASGPLSANRVVDTSGRNPYFLEVEMSDEGIVRVMTSRFSEDMHGEQVLFETMLPVLVRQTIDIAGKVSEESGYRGQWQFAVVATKIAGLVAHLHGSGQSIGEIAVSADQSEYTSATTASSSEVLTTPWNVARRLTGRFIRSLDISDMREVREATEEPT